ncbi:dde superfamily endonuclease [Holotrichia oblita]|uniref:Dde superfamily endonuclease n=1 Tax=Holotrichia oblita TaxID=644536 RepID=A0ACB9SYD0_HOLOL|nr:dde superfamily endonuclease [Holotrichia oblita]
MSILIAKIIHTSICLQAICQEKRKSTVIFIGFPGSTHYSRMLKTLKSYCIIHSPCLKSLLTRYKDDGHLTCSKKFNITLSSCRVYIEHSYFDILKQRFRQLYYCKLQGMEILCHFIQACCMLHNLSDNDDFESNLENVSDT